MSKGKLQKFAEMETFKNVFQYPYSVIENMPFEMKGRWRDDYFHNNNPIVLELGCGRIYRRSGGEIPGEEFHRSRYKRSKNAQGCKRGFRGKT